MTMRVTMIDTRMGESGSLLNAGSTYTVSNEFGAWLIGLRRATDTDGTLQSASADDTTIASRSVTIADGENVILVNSASAVVLTILSDAVGGFSGRAAVACYQEGAGSATFVAGAGVTILGAAPSPAQHAITGLIRVRANTWAYI